MGGKCVRALVSGFIAVACAGCGADPGIVTKHPQFEAVAPETPGSLESLQETIWEYRGAYYEFKPDGELSVDVLGQVQPGTYTYEKGVLGIAMEGDTILHGTWDGVNLVIEGRIASPAESQ